MEDESKATLPTQSAADHSARETYVLVYDRRSEPSNWLNWQDVRAVISVGELTNEHFTSVRHDFEKHYSGRKHVNYMLEESGYANSLSADDRPEAKILRCLIEVLFKQNEVLCQHADLSDDIKQIAESFAFIVNAIITSDGSEHKGVVDVRIIEIAPGALKSLKEMLPSVFSKEDIIDVIAEGFKKGLLRANALSQKAEAAKIRAMQEEMLLKEGYQPIDIARIQNPNAGDIKHRKESQRISNASNKRKKTSKKASCGRKRKSP